MNIAKMTISSAGKEKKIEVGLIRQKNNKKMSSLKIVVPPTTRNVFKTRLLISETFRVNAEFEFLRREKVENSKARVKKNKERNKKKKMIMRKQKRGKKQINKKEENDNT